MLSAKDHRKIFTTIHDINLKTLDRQRLAVFFYLIFTYNKNVLNPTLKPFKEDIYF